MPLSNKMEPNKIPENIAYIIKNKLLDNIQDLTPLCIELVASIFECL